MRLIVALFLLVISSSPAAALDWVTLDSGGDTVDRPHRRAWASGAYDPIGDRFFIFGGRHGNSTNFNDLWAYDLSTGVWTEHAAPNGPPPRRLPSMSWDVASQRLLIWNGHNSSAGVFYDDLWAYDPATSQWEELLPPGGIPLPRYGSAWTTFPDGRQLAFSGFTNQNRFPDLWWLDSAAPSWTMTGSTATNPPARCLHTMEYDASRNNVVIYGGQIGAMLDELWVLDMDTGNWAEQSLAGRPSGRSLVASVLEKGEDRMLVFGGHGGGGTYYDDLWAVSMADYNWSQPTVSGVAPPQLGAMAYAVDSLRNRLLIFGGRGGTNGLDWFNGVWALDGLKLAAVSTPGPYAQFLTSPNPSSGDATRIQFELRRGAKVLLQLVDLRGRLIREIHSGDLEAGPVQFLWDGRDASGRSVAAGVYHLQLDVAGERQQQKLVRLD